MSAEPPLPVTEDTLLGGRVRLRQPAEGYRAAIDPVLLAAAVPAAAGETVLDVGAGVGAAALCLAARVPGVKVSGIELQREQVHLASENVRLNGMQGRVEVMVGDIAAAPVRLAPGSFHHVMANPPHLDPIRAQAPPGEDKARAHVEEAGGLPRWIDFMLRMVRPKGGLTLIHRADRLDELLAALAGRLGEMVVFPLWPGPAESEVGRPLGRAPAKRVIVRGRKGVATPLRLAPGLVLHREGGGYTPEAEAVLRHGASLDI
jgi:tRNA1(Val) A37 N6-methylase TrmN6